MRNLLGRLHARHLSELLRIAHVWGVPVQVESKSEVVGALYRAMTDPRAMRDVWDRLDEAERAVAQLLANLPETAPPPTLAELASHLEVPETEAREAALRLFRRGMLTREGDSEPLPIGVTPRLLLPRELAQGVRRLQDEMAAGDLTRAPLRVLIELLDDMELEAAAGIWELRSVPGIARRRDLASRLLRLINDARRVDRVVQSRGRDAATIWKLVRAEKGAVALRDVAAAAGLAGADTISVARLRAALSELEASLLVWHAYRDGARLLFVPPEIRSPSAATHDDLPPLVEVEIGELTLPWRHPDAVAWDLLTLLRTVSDPQAPVWDPKGAPPRWLARAAGPRFWFHTLDGPPAGYVELLLELGLGEGVLAIDEESQPPRVVAGPHVRSWRERSFATQTASLRDRWLRLGRWVEGEPVGLVEVWGADWRGMRPRVLSALAGPDVGLTAGRAVTLESLAARLAARYPALLGPSFMAATARQAGEADADADEHETRLAALADVIAIELSGAFAWFGLTQVVDAPGGPRAISLTERGSALGTRKSPPVENEPPAALAPLLVDVSGEITLRVPSPDRVWALWAFTEQVDLGRESHYRLTSGSITAALTAGVELDQIARFLERGGRQPLPDKLRANLAAWSRRFRGARLQRALVVRVHNGSERDSLMQALREGHWTVEAFGQCALLVWLNAGPLAPANEEDIVSAIRAAGYAPRWSEASDRAKVVTATTS
jgi:Helicase conserved C-terminal domain